MKLYVANKGSITPGLVAEILHSLLEARSSGCLTLTQENTICRLYFNKGTVVHKDLTYLETANNDQYTLASEQGIRFMGRLLMWQTGSYEFNPSLTSDMRTLNLAVDWKKALKIMESVQDLDRFERRARVFLQPRTAKRGGSITEQGVTNSKPGHSFELSQIPIKLKTYLSPQHKSMSASTIRRQIAGRGGGFVRQQSTNVDKKVQLFEAINGQRSLLDLARFLSWSVEEIREVMAQLHSEGAVEFN